MSAGNAHPACSDKHGSGFAFVNLKKLIAAERLRFPFHIELLTAANPIDPSCCRQQARAFCAYLGRKIRRKDRTEGFRLQSVARKRCGALSIDDMIRGFPAAKIIVIHARKVVMNERIRMYHFDCAGNRQRSFYISATGITERQHQNRTQTLAACIQAVAHGLKQHMLRRIRKIKVSGKRVIRKFFIFLICSLKIDHDRPPKHIILRDQTQWKQANRLPLSGAW